MLEKINVNINKNDPSINEYLYCVSEFNQIPNKTDIFETYNIDNFTKYLSSISEDINISKEILPNGEDYIINEKRFVSIKDIFLSYVIHDKNSEFAIVTDISIYFKKQDTDLVESIIKDISEFKVDFQNVSVENRINILTLNQDGLHISPIDTIDADYENIELYYNSKSFKIANKAIKNIKNQNKGLTIIWGDRGVGKTTLCCHMISNIDKICIFVPSNLMDLALNSNEFRTLMKRYKNSIVVLDDCEMYFSSTISKSNIYSNNLLQFVDGVASDSDSIQIIAIFNTDSEETIDPVIFDCNNLNDIIPIDNLSEDEINELCSHLKQKNKFKNSREIRLIDILKKKKTSDHIEMGF